jgi:CRISPR/Cas system-associated protein Cas5 (RAMP superfamily)
MKITAYQNDTGLSQTYYLETASTVTGTIVTVRDNDQKRTILGQFTNNRQGIGDARPLEGIVSYSYKMAEVLELFGRVENVKRRA